MPTYEYRCSQGHHFELFQRISEAPVDRCPQCGAPAERQISGAGLIFKGSGFYITDYRSDTYKKAAEKESSASTSSEGASSSSNSSGSSGSSSSSSSGSSSAPESKPSSGGSNAKD